MTYFGDKDAAPKPTRTERPVWVTLVGAAMVLAAIAFLALALGFVIGSGPTMSYAFAGLAVAGAFACAGGYVYVTRERGE